jgi:nicotinamide-nucleotide amidase
VADGTSSRLVHLLVQRGLTIAVAESLTGGLLVAELIRTPGASATVLGGVVAYDTELKHTLLGVDAALLAEHGPVHPEVARQMALGVRSRLAVRGRDADVGVATTGVAGPEMQGGAAVGTAFVGLAVGDRVEVARLHLVGDRAAIRSGAVSESLARLEAMLLDRERPAERE